MEPKFQQVLWFLFEAAMSALADSQFLTAGLKLAMVHRGLLPEIIPSLLCTALFKHSLFHSKYTIPPTPHEGHDISKCMLQISLKFSNVEVQVHITYYYLDRSDRKWVWERDWEWDQECRSDSDMVGMLPLALRLPQYFCKDFSIFHVTMWLLCSSQVRKKNLRRS